MILLAQKHNHQVHEDKSGAVSGVLNLEGEDLDSGPCSVVECVMWPLVSCNLFTSQAVFHGNVSVQEDHGKHPELLRDRME